MAKRKSTSHNSTSKKSKPEDSSKKEISDFKPSPSDEKEHKKDVITKEDQVCTVISNQICVFWKVLN